MNKNYIYINVNKVIYSRFKFVILSFSLLAGSSWADISGTCTGSKKSTTTPSSIVTAFNNPERHPNFVFVCAHRGFWTFEGYPQNSLAAINATYDAGIECVENDIRYTSDNRAVIFHDPNMDMMVVDSEGDPVTGHIEDFTWIELQTFFLRDRLLNPTTQKIPSIEQFITAVKNKIVGNYEFKSPGGSHSKAYFIDLITLLHQQEVLNESILKGQLSPEDYQEVIASVSEVSYEDVTYVPKYFYETPKEQITLEMELFRSMGVKGYELVVENDDEKYDDLKSLFPILDRNFERYGQFDIFPESGRGRYRKTNIWRKTNPADDYRGNWDWIFKDNYSFIISDRPCLIMEYLSRLNKRDL